MKVIITRKRYNDVHTYTRVKSVVVEKKGRLFPDMEVDVEFAKGATSHYKSIAKGATSHYKSKEHDVFWEIDPSSTPGAGSSGCSKIEIFEDCDS